MFNIKRIALALSIVALALGLAMVNVFPLHAEEGDVSFSLEDPVITSATTNSVNCTFDIKNETDDPGAPIAVASISATVAAAVKDSDYTVVANYNPPNPGVIAADATVNVNCDRAFTNQPNATSLRVTVTVTVTGADDVLSASGDIELADPD